MPGALSAPCDSASSAAGIRPQQVGIAGSQVQCDSIRMRQIYNCKRAGHSWLLVQDPASGCGHCERSRADSAIAAPPSGNPATWVGATNGGDEVMVRCFRCSSAQDFWAANAALR